MDRRYGECATILKGHQPIGFGLEHRKAGRVIQLYEQRALAARYTIRLADTAAADGSCFGGVCLYSRVALEFVCGLSQIQDLLT